MSSSPSSSASPPPPPQSPSPLPLTAAESKPQSPPKKPPPLPWTHQETLALIQAYQEKWYSLKKGQLKAFQWEEVAVTVAARCGFDEPSKTSTQCRHKIEKLRKRYRSELQKPYPNSWQYFDLMDRMERGPTSFNARPIAVVKSPPINTSSLSNNGNHGYASLYSSSADYYNNNNNRNNNRGDGDDGDGGGGGSDESDEEWNGGYNVEAAASRNKSKSVNNVVRVRGGVKSRVRSAKRVAMERGFSDGDRVARVLRNPINEKRKHFYNVDDGDGDGDGGDDDEEEDEEEMEVEDEDEGEENRGGAELAAEIKGFAERFMRMESRKIEMMRETERYRMEMEKKRLDMILDAQRKIVDTISRGFGDHKKAKMTRES